MSIRKPKYRPSFSAEEILELHHILHSSPSISNDSLYSSILTKVDMLHYKLDRGIASPAYVEANKPKDTMLSQLGGEPTHTMTMAVCYTKYIDNPGSLSSEDIIKALDYKQYELGEKLTTEEQELVNASFGM